jgi:glutamate-1-semialdehyde 2,1-aminomutase
VTDGAVRDTRVVPYNVVPELDDNTACVIVEPIAANMGLVGPAPGFLDGLRAECDRVGALLVFDEVITGFRVARGGAQQLFHVRPDLSTFGKVIGGGLPIGAYGGRRDVMSCVAPLGPVYQAGTLSGNPLATAAGLAALDLLDDAAYARLETTARDVGLGLAKSFTDTGDLNVHVPVEGSLVGVFFGTLKTLGRPIDYVEARTTDEAAYARFFHALLDQGVAIAPGAYEVMFPGLAHTPAVVEEIVAAAERAVASMR